MPYSGLAQAICALLAHYEADQSRAQVIVHGDLVEEHLLLSPRQDSLSGVLDFGDVALGDPADDLKGFWAYGQEAATYVLEGLNGGAADSTLLDRSHRAYLRYQIDRFLEGLDDNSEVDEVEAEGRALHELLSHQC